jgi:hypothetical protein
MNTVWNVRTHKWAWYLTALVTFSFTRRVMLHGVIVDEHDFSSILTQYEAAEPYPKPDESSQYYWYFRYYHHVLLLLFRWPRSGYIVRSTVTAVNLAY